LRSLRGRALAVTSDEADVAPPDGGRDAAAIDPPTAALTIATAQAADRRQTDGSGHPFLHLCRRGAVGLCGQRRRRAAGWSDQQRAATSAETAVRLLQIGWSVDVRAAARRIACPVLIVHPERDKIVPLDEGRLIASLIPDARFVQLDSENHMPLPNEPEWPRLLGEIRKFLAASEADAAAGRNALALDQLTPRERAVLEAIAQGLDNKEIAEALGLSEKSVRNHVSNVFDKLSVRHRYEAIVLARDAGLGRTKEPMAR